jgi:hypothetical protein
MGCIRVEIDISIPSAFSSWAKCLMTTGEVFHHHGQHDGSSDRDFTKTVKEQGCEHL